MMKIELVCNKISPSEVKGHRLNDFFESICRVVRDAIRYLQACISSCFSSSKKLPPARLEPLPLPPAETQSTEKQPGAAVQSPYSSARRYLLKGLVATALVAGCIAGSILGSNRGVSQHFAGLDARPLLIAHETLAPQPVEVAPFQPDTVHVFTSYTLDNAQRVGMSRKVMNAQRKYCELYGYRYEVFEKNMAGSSLPYWSKIAGINHLLESSNSEWIVWIDDDAVILNSYSLLEFIRAHGGNDPETHVIVTKDIPQAPTDVNTGVLIVRNSDISRRFFKQLWEMRGERINGKPYTYDGCPNQECLHEQQAMHDLLRAENNGEFRSHVKIIPQRDSRGIGLNTFERSSHYDVSRKMHLIYRDSPESKCDLSKDFICQCTGLATKGTIHPSPVIKNLREECIDRLIEYASRILGKK